MAIGCTGDEVIGSCPSQCPDIVGVGFKVSKAAAAWIGRRRGGRNILEEDSEFR
jgi:hypothetical protein